MAQAAHIVRQSDFSGGELREDVKRRDDVPQVRSGGRQLANWRVKSSGSLTDRPGRVALFRQEGRTETIMLPGDRRFRLSFGNGSISIRDAAGVVVATDAGYPWTEATVGKVSFAVVSSDIVICFPGMMTRVVRRASDGSWSFTNWTFTTGAQGEIRAPFYRFPETYGIKLTPGGRGGSISLTFSAPFLDSAHVGAVVRYKGFQILVTAVASPTIGTGTVLQQLPPAQVITLGSTDGFAVGQVVSGYASNATGEVTAVAGNTITVQIKSVFTGFQSAEKIIGPISRSDSSAVAAAAPQPTADWDEQAISPRRGWPQACLYDRTRLTFFDLPAVPEGVIWSSLDTYTDFLVGADANNAIFELVPGRKHVLYMLGGPDQFVFTDDGVFYVPISASVPLKPGNVQFIQISSDGCGPVRPAITTEGIVFLNVGLRRAIAITLLGATTKPYEATDINELADHLLKTPVCMAFSRGDAEFSERYLHVVNADGTVAVARMASNKQWVGWSPWSGAGAVKWVSALGTEVLHNVLYSGATIVESLSDAVDMDGVVSLNAIVPDLAPSAGQGPLWFWAGETADLQENGRDFGNREIDATGNLVTLPNDDFSGADVVAGRAWRSTFEPFVPHVPEGTDYKQTQRRRRVRQVMVCVLRSTGFTWGRRTIPPVAWGEEGGDAPVECEDTFRFREMGRSTDPRPGPLVKDRPGSLDIVEIDLEVTI
jgi:hypothetical protein